MKVQTVITSANVDLYLDVDKYKLKYKMESQMQI